MKESLVTQVSKNIVFVLEFLGIALAVFLVAYIAEKWIKKKNHDTERILSTRKIAMIGMFSAIAAVLHVLDFPIPFLAPGFYKLDFSELPALIGTFAFGPVAGVMIEFVKILLKLLFKGTSTAFVGDLANFVIGCSFLLPAAFIYEWRKNKKDALIGCITGTAVMTVFGSIFNAVYLLPAFAALFGMSISDIIAAGNAVNGGIKDITTFVMLAVAPLNLLKGSVISLLTMLLYKKVSPLIKYGKSQKNKN